MIGEPVSVTVWPGQIVPVPQLVRYPQAELDGEFIWLGEAEELAEPPAELYLRQARRLDRAAPGELVLEIAREVGGVLSFHDATPDFPTDLGKRGGDERIAIFSAIHGRRFERARTGKAVQGWRIHVDAVAFRLRMLDILGRHVVAYRKGDYLADVWRAVTQDYGRHTGNPYPPPPGTRSEAEAWSQFRQLIDPALARFHVRVIVPRHDGYSPGEHGVTILEAGALQIMNDLARAADYLVCPSCGTTFARQVGGSTHFARSTGVTYCSPRCATNARVRAYRERKRAARRS